MSLHHYTVTELRLGASCPRVHYFDAEHTRRHGLVRRRVTQLWKEGGAPAGGALFHRAVEKFNRLAAEAKEIVEALERAREATELHQAIGRFFNERCLDRAAIAVKSVDFQRGFSAALFAYLEELSNLAYHARSRGIASSLIVEQLFGDPRKRVDVTFDLLDGQAVRVTGSIDYVFYDWRTQRHRILDYKLTPSSAPHGDIVQVSAYALMHDKQHGTRPDVAVFYLHPARRMVEKPWEDVLADQAKIYDYLASMLGWESYDEATRTGLKPPGDPSLCSHCPWRNQCEARLGPKAEGDVDRGWSARLARGEAAAPKVETRLPQPTVDDEIEEAGEELMEAPPSSRGQGAPSREDALQRSASALEPDRLFVGFTDPGRAPITVPRDVLNTHVAVVGAAGSGKTYTAKIIAEEAVRNGVPVLAIDPQGDLVQMCRAMDERDVAPELLAAYRDFHARVEPRIYTPGSSHAERLSLNPIRLPKPGELDHIRDPALREEQESLLVQAVAANLVSLASVGGDRQSQETFLYQVLLGLPRAGAVSLAQIVRAMRDPETVGIDEPEELVKKGDRDRLALRLNSYVLGPAARLFEGGQPLDLDKLVAPTAEGRVPFNVIYLNALANDEQKQFFVASLAAEIYRWMVTRVTSAAGRTNLLFYIDEARDYIPAGTKITPAKQPLIRLFTQGRKYGVGCLLCTQSPRSVDYNVFGNCSTKLIGRLESSQDVDRIREWFTTDAPPTWLGGRKGAEKGSFVARWAGGTRPDGDAFKGRKLFTIHEGAWSPDRVELESRARRG